MKHLFIINPVAGKGKGIEFIKEIETLLEGKADYHIEITKQRGDATQIARRYTSEGEYIVYAVGGDGTINEVVNGMAGSSSALAIVPTGSGNDFIRTLYPKCAKEDLLHKLLEGQRECIDLVKADEKYFLNIASVGIDAEIVFNAEPIKKIKYIKEDMAYIISIFKTLFKHKSKQFKVMLDGKENCHKKILLLAVANGRFYGGGIPIAPHAQLDDAKIDICLVRDLKLGKILTIIPKLFKARHEEDKAIEVYKVKKIEIESDEIFRLNIDGEILQTNKVKMEIIPQAIQIVVPAC